MEKEEEKSLTASILTLTNLVGQLRSMRYLQMVDNPKKFLFYSFLAGVTRGVGFAFGLSLIFVLVIWLLSKLTVVPLLGDWIVTLLDYIQKTKVY